MRATPDEVRAVLGDPAWRSQVVEPAEFYNRAARHYAEPGPPGTDALWFSRLSREHWSRPRTELLADAVRAQLLFGAGIELDIGPGDLRDAAWWAHPDTEACREVIRRLYGIDYVDWATPPPPADVQKSIMTEGERLVEAVRAFSNFEPAAAVRERHRPTGRKPARSAREIPRADELLQRWAVLSSPRPPSGLSAEDREVLLAGWGLDLRAPEQRHCPVHGAVVGWWDGAWRCSAEPRKCHRRARRHGRHLRRHAVRGGAIERDEAYEPSGRYHHYDRCADCGGRSFEVREWYADPCGECGRFVPCEHPPGKADEPRTRGTEAKSRRSPACAGCGQLVCCLLCGHALASTKGNRLGCPECASAFATDRDKRSRQRCPACGGTRLRRFRGHGELRARSAWWCDECGETSYTDVAEPKAGAAPSADHDGRLALAPVGIALRAMAEDPRGRWDLTAWWAYAAEGLTYAQVAERALERGWRAPGSRRRSEDGAARAVQRARARFGELVEILPRGELRLVGEVRPTRPEVPKGN